MFGFFKRNLDDEPRAREFVRQVFELGRETCRLVGSTFQTTTAGNFSFPVTNDTSMEISLAILGTSLSILKGHTKIISIDRGCQIESWCKRSIREDYDLPAESASKLIKAIDDYQVTFEKAIKSDINPFGETSGMMLARCLGPQINTLYIGGTTTLNPFVHQVIGDVMTLTVSQATTFWKGK